MRVHPSLKKVGPVSRLHIDGQRHLTEGVEKRVAKDLSHLRACTVVLQLLPKFDLTARSALFVFTKRSNNAIKLSLYGGRQARCQLFLYLKLLAVIYQRKVLRYNFSPSNDIAVIRQWILAASIPL